jgi:hypothetical protein
MEAETVEKTDEGVTPVMPEAVCELQELGAVPALLGLT